MVQICSASPDLPYVSTLSVRSIVDHTFRDPSMQHGGFVPQIEVTRFKTGLSEDGFLGEDVRSIEQFVLEPEYFRVASKHRFVD